MTHSNCTDFDGPLSFHDASKTHHYLSVDRGGKLQVLKARLHGEGVGIEPLQQGHVQGRAGVAVLGCMDVGVHHSWHEELTAVQQAMKMVQTYGTVFMAHARNDAMTHAHVLHSRGL